jgi:hypothetical protein
VWARSTAVFGPPFLKQDLRIRQCFEHHLARRFDLRRFHQPIGLETRCDLEKRFVHVDLLVLPFVRGWFVRRRQHLKDTANYFCLFPGLRISAEALMDGKEFGEALICELKKRQKRRVQSPLTWESFAEAIGDVFDPKPEEDNSITPYPMPQIPAEFPKLKVKYGGNELKNVAGLTAQKIMEMQASSYRTAQAWIVVNNWIEEEPFHSSGWYTRPMKELEILKADGVPEYQLPRKSGVA